MDYEDIDVMKSIYVLFSGNPSYKRVLFRNEDRKWRYRQNWKVNVFWHEELRWIHWGIILPFLRFTKCNGKIEIGLGNHFLEIGW